MCNLLTQLIEKVLCINTRLVSVSYWQILLNSSLKLMIKKKVNINLI